MKKLKIAVVIPVYNGEGHIRNAVDSVLQQTYAVSELIIVDDGSTDGTPEILKEYLRKVQNTDQNEAQRKGETKAGNSNRETEISVICQENGGVSAARNTGIDLVSADYVIFLDADDRLSLDAVEKFYRYWQEDPDVFLAGRNQFVKGFERDRNKVEPGLEEIRTTQFTSREARMQISGMDFGFQSACSKMFSTDVIRRNHLYFDSSIRFGEDGLFVYQYLTNIEKVLYIDTPIQYVLINASSATRSDFNIRWFDGVQSVDRMLLTCPDDLEMTKYLSDWRINKIYALMRRYFKDAKDSSLYPEIRKRLHRYTRDVLMSDCAGKSKLVWIVMLLIPEKVMKRIWKNF